MKILPTNLKGFPSRFAIIAINRPAIFTMVFFCFVCLAVLFSLGVCSYTQSEKVPLAVLQTETRYGRIWHLMLVLVSTTAIYMDLALKGSLNLSIPTHSPIQIHTTYFQLTMEKELEDLWSKISLNELEEKQVEISGNQAALSNRLLLGRFIGQKTISLQQLTILLKKLWPVSTLKAAQVDDGAYIFELASREACLKVYKDQPWHVGGVLLAVRILADQENMEDMQISKVPFWVQIHSYQFFNTTEENGRLIAQMVGDVIEVDVDKQAIAWGKFLRVRVLIDVEKPLCRWGNPVINGKILFVLFRFEKIVEYCFGCDFIDHVLRDCMLRFNPDGSTKKVAYKYPMWLRAEGYAGVAFGDLKRFLETSRYMVEALEKGKEKVSGAPVSETQGSRLLLEGPMHQGQGFQVGSSERKDGEQKTPMEVETVACKEDKEAEVPVQKRSRTGATGDRSSSASQVHGGYMGTAPFKSRKREQVTTFRDLKVTKKRNACVHHQTPKAKYRKIAPRPTNMPIQSYQMMPVQQHPLQSLYPRPQMHYPPPEQMRGFTNVYGQHQAGFMGPLAAELWGITKQALQLGQMDWDQNFMGSALIDEAGNRDTGVRIEPLDAEDGWAGGSGLGQDMGLSNSSVGWGGGVGPSN